MTESDRHQQYGFIVTVNDVPLLWALFESGTLCGGVARQSLPPRSGCRAALRLNPEAPLSALQRFVSGALTDSRQHNSLLAVIQAATTQIGLEYRGTGVPAGLMVHVAPPNWFAALEALSQEEEFNGDEPKRGIAVRRSLDPTAVFGERTKDRGYGA